jgi:tellurite methyltransferase
MDKNYWELYYSKQNSEYIPSLFAKFVLENFMPKNANLIELGCGNGRDSLFFADNSVNVVAVDQVESEIEFLKHRFDTLNNIRFLAADFTNLSNGNKFNVVYSRFTLHAITTIEEKRVLNWAFNNLFTNGFLCIEARGQKNEIFKLGEPVTNEPDAFIYNGHFRRFLNLDNLCKSLITLGFTINYANEEKGYAPFNNTDETFLRVIAQKN